MSRANAISRSAYNRRYQAGRYQDLKAAGLCRWCGKAPAKLNQQGKPGCRCEACASKAAKASRKNLKRRRKGWRALGICLVCGCREAITGQRWCAVCAERRSRHRGRA